MRFLSLFFFVSFASTGSVLINGTAAKVGEEVITLEDTRQYYALEKFRKKAEGPLTVPDPESQRQVVQKLIFEHLVLLEIKSLQVNEVTREDSIKRLKVVKDGRLDQWKKILQSIGLKESEAIDLYFRSMRVERFVQKKVETLTPIITDAEIERYYRQNEERFGKSSLDSLKNSIVLFLKKQKVEQGLEEWIRYLKTKYGVTNYLETNEATKAPSE